MRQPLVDMGTSLSREAAALLACDVEEPQEPASKDIDYDQFFKDCFKKELATFHKQAQGAR